MVNAVSTNLDILGQVPGDMLARGPEDWTRIPGAALGSVLTSQGPNELPAWKAAGSQVRLVKSTTQSAPASAITVINWNSAGFDDDAFWDAGTPGRITVPAGVARINLTGGWFSDTSAAASSSIFFRDSAAAVVTGQRIDGALFIRQQIASGPLAVSEGDWFELAVQPSLTKTIGAGMRTFFAAEVTKAA